MTIDFELPQKQTLKPTITVFGVGGGGCNAVNNMIASNLEGVNFVVANTDAQSLDQSLCESRIQLGENITQGLGAGSYPEVGRASAEEAGEEVLDFLHGRNMVFVTAGMGGGTGTGAAPVVARIAREQGILTVGVVTKPFHFEGTHRMRVAELGIQELQKFVDTLIVIPNQNLFRVADKGTTFRDAFKLADEVLHSGVRGITDLMVMPGLINLDFADVRSVMSEMGKAMMGTGTADGENRAIDAAEAAIANPLLDNVSMHGARGVLINITGGMDMTLFEVDEAANRIREEVDQEANIIFGSAFDQEMEGKVRVSVVATGIDSEIDYEDSNEAVASAPPQRQNFAVGGGFGQNSAAAKADNTETKPSYLNIHNPATSVDEENADSSGGDFVAPAPVEPRRRPEVASAAANDTFHRQTNTSDTEQYTEENKNDSDIDEAGIPANLFDSLEKKRSSGIFGGFFGGKPESAGAESDNREKELVTAGGGGDYSEQAIAPAGKRNGLGGLSDGSGGDADDEGFAGVGDSATGDVGGTSAKSEDELDIPAFLRRK